MNGFVFDINSMRLESGLVQNCRRSMDNKSAIAWEGGMMKWCCRVLGGWNRPAFTSNSWIHSEKERERERTLTDRGSFVIHFLLVV